MTDFVIGQKVAIYQAHYTDGVVQVATIERDTKMYWVADGRKFRKSDGLEPGSSSTWGRGRYLLPLDDPRVIEAQAAARIRSGYGQVAKAEDALRKDRENPQRIKELQEALAIYADILGT